MIRVIPVLFGWLFTVVTSWSLGMILFRKLSLTFHKWEERLLAFVAGSACLSALMFVLCVVRLVHRGVLLALAAAILGYAVYSGVFRSLPEKPPPLSKTWRWIFGLGLAAFTYIGFFNALAPEHSSDGMSYHLNVVFKYQHAHGFAPITTDFYASLSQGIELLYLFAFDFGRNSAATLVHFTFLLTLVFLVFVYGRRIGRPEVGAAAALFTYGSPIVLRDGSIAYVDVALAAVLFALFYLLQVWDENRDPKMLIPIGLLAGFGYEVKYTAVVAVPYAVGFVAWKLWRARQPVLRPALVVSLVAASCLAGWMVKNWIEVANPVSPFANRLFPNPYVHISFEEGYRKYFTHYDLTNRWRIPWEVTVGGEHLEGFLGPLFLLTPLALFGLRSHPGRQLLLAAAIFGSTYFGNIGTRFLISVVPFLAVAIALVLADIRWLLPAVAIVNCILCLPPLYRLYCAPNAYRIEDVPVKAALRLQSEDAYLSQDPDYLSARMIGSVVPPNEPVFAINQGGQAYLPRDLLTGYESASNEVLQQILWTPVIRDYQPTRVYRFDFPARALRKLRVLQMASLPNQQWSISELRVFNGPNEMPRDPAWRLTARPNPWDVQLAFDNSPATRWQTWQPAEPGMYVEVDFGTLQTLSGVTIESSEDIGNVLLKLLGAGGDGVWLPVSDHPVQSRQAIHVSLRRAATEELKARGIHYLVVKPDNPGADDMRSYPSYWGIQLVGSSGDTRLYRIE